MYYVYLLRSKIEQEQKYVGFTEDLKLRVKEHNSGKSKHTKKYAPWDLIFYSAFQDKHKALDFEKYLKSHSGRAFSEKRLYN